MGHGLMQHDSMMSVRKMPWHGLGVVLPEYPKSIDDAIQKAGLGWKVRQGEILVCHAPEWKDDFGNVHAADIRTAKGFKANLRQDTGDVLGIVSDDYKIVQNEDAFRFLDALINSDLHFETAGSLMNGKRVWVLARLPEWVEVGGDETAMYVFVANSHDGSMAVTAAATDVRIVCANTLGWALRKTEVNEAAQRTFKFRHTGDLQLKFDEARKVMGMTLNYATQFKQMGDFLAQQPITKDTLKAKVLDPMFKVEEGMGDRAVKNRETAKELILDIFSGKGPDGDTTGNSPGTKWTAVNAVAEFADWQRRYTKRTDQMQRSFEDQSMKQQALDLVVRA